MPAQVVAIVPAASPWLSHHEACRIADLAVKKNPRAKTVIIDMKNAIDATTSAFARLVLLRRYLLRTGRDLRLTGLSHRAARLYEVSRLDRVLPAWQRPLQLA